MAATAAAAARHSAAPSSRAKKPKKIAKSTNPLTPDTLDYWAEGGGAKPWRFKCKCGEQCRSSDPTKFHPVGEQFECTRCNTWSHVHCVLGPETSADDLEELEELLCFPCRSVSARASYLRLQSISLTWVPGQGAVEQKQNCEGEEDLSTTPEPSVRNQYQSDSLGTDYVEQVTGPEIPHDIPLQVVAPDEVVFTEKVGEKRPLIAVDIDNVD